MSAAILAGLLQIVTALAIIGVAVLATSLWWALCERLAEAQP